MRNTDIAAPEIMSEAPACVRAPASTAIEDTATMMESAVVMYAETAARLRTESLGP